MLSKGDVESVPLVLASRGAGGPGVAWAEHCASPGWNASADLDVGTKESAGEAAHVQ